MNVNDREYFKFVGRLVGKAIVEGYLLDAHFAKPFYKHMLGVPVSFQDLKEVDEEYYKVFTFI
jgi:E3 ubiquitin-protein ligase HUWE1